MKKTFVMVMILMLMLVTESAIAEWVEIPLRLNEENDMEAVGHAFASEMPGGEVYIVGRAIFTNSTNIDRWIQEAYISVFTEQANDERINLTILGEEKKISPKIVERCGGMAAMSFSGIVRGIPMENLACQLNETSIRSPLICSPRGVVEAKIYEDKNKNLNLQILFDDPIEVDYDVGWGIVDKDNTLQWYEADCIPQGSKEAALRIPFELRAGYLDSIEDIDYAFAELYVHIDTAD